MQDSVIYQSIREEAIQEGIQQGIQQVTSTLLRNGRSVEEVARATGLSIEQVRSLQSEM